MEQFLINKIMFNAKIYDQWNDIKAMEEAYIYLDRLRKFKGFETLTEAFEYFENNL